MVVVFVLLCILAVGGVLIAFNPVSPKLRWWTWGLYLGGSLLFAGSLGLLAYGYTLGMETRQPLPSWLSPLFWPSLSGIFIGPVCMIIALVIAVSSRVKRT